MPATPASLLARQEAITAQYHEHSDIVQEIQQQAIEELLPLVLEEGGGDETSERARAFLKDRVTVFRFCRRARFSPSASLKLLHATLAFRFSPTSSLPPPTVSPLYLNSPLFFFHPSLRDKFGRPCAVLNLREVRRTEDGELSGLKDFVRLGWEMGRRWLSELSKEGGEDGVKLQMVVIVDLEGAGMSNLEVELLPFFMDLLKSHFPGMVGAIFVLNYGWMYAGMWQLAKRVLPNTALERILFPSKEELREFFEEDNLLIEHGGTLQYSYTPQNPILLKYGRSSLSQPTTPILSKSSLPALSHTSPTPIARPASALTGEDGSANPSPSPSPSQSSTSIHTMASASEGDTFHSAPSTRPPTPSLDGRPTFLTRRPSGLSMTTLKSPASINEPASKKRGLSFSLGSWGRKKPATDEEEPLPSAGGAGTALRRVTSFAELQERLAETQKAIQSDDSDLSESGFDPEESEMDGPGVEDELQAEPERYDVEGEGTDGQGGTLESSRAPSTAATSARSSRATSRNVSRNVSREGSPSSWRARRDGGEGFSSRAQRFSGLHSLSPYNHSNPYYGYPAFVPSPTTDPLNPHRIPQPHFHRRRKRDLVRTLTYLAVLRFLALHRSATTKMGDGVGGLLRVLRVGGPKTMERKVHWEGETAVAVKSHKSDTQRHAEQLFTLIFLFLLLRTPNLASKTRSLVRTFFLRLPVQLLSLLIDGLATAGSKAMVMIRRDRVQGAGRKRDVLRRAVGEGGRRLVEWAEKGSKG